VDRAGCSFSKTYAIARLTSYTLLRPKYKRALCSTRETHELPRGKMEEEDGRFLELPCSSRSAHSDRPRYQETTGAQNMLLLDRVIEVTGYARKYAIQREFWIRRYLEWVLSTWEYNEAVC
jgi:hypothetical protein